MENAPRVVIIGGGFGGINALKALRDTKAEIIVVDKRNYHLFQPLLYQVATAALNPSQIAVPLRRAVKLQGNCSVYLAEVTGIDLLKRQVSLGDANAPLMYDYLVVATGVETNYFGRPEWAKFAPGLKTVEEALGIRRRFLLAFEQAEMVTDEKLRSELLTFVIVGGGPTGVELAGAMAEIAHTTLTCSFRRFNAASARVILIDSGERVLKAFAPANSAAAMQQLEGMGVEVLLNARVTDVNGEEVEVSIKGHGGEANTSRTIRTRQVVWAAGVKGTGIGEMLGATGGSGGRVPVGPTLSLDRHPEVFVVGDLAQYTDPGSGQVVPGVAQGAIQMGSHAGRIISAEIGARAAGRAAPPRLPFRYNDKGSMATIGRGQAVVQFKSFSLRGLIAWVLWAVIHVLFLTGFRNRIGIMLEWVWMYLFHERGVRLITGSDEVVSTLMMPKDKRLVAKGPSDSAPSRAFVG